ncbi:MAG: MFS transporter [Candidatus Rokubacteria bacterium]|nr:MFS transporter [Candidatus Rokubacteria bacterium]
MSPILAYRAFVWVTVTNFFFFASLNGFVLLPLYIHRLGGTEVEIGFVMGLYSATGIVCQPVIGPWVDAFGRKPFMLLGAGLVVASALLATVVASVPWLALVRALQGIGFSAFFVASFAYVVDLVPPARRGWALGIYGVSGLLSTALAPLAGEWVIRRYGFRPLWAACVLVAGIALVLASRLRERRRGEALPLSGIRSVREGFGEILQRHMAVTVFFGLGTGTIFAFLPTFAESLGVSTLSLFYTGYAGAAMAVRVFAGRLVDTHGRRAVIVPSMFVQTAATGLLAALGLLVSRTSQTPVLPVLLLAGLLAGGAHGFLYPGLAALVADQTSRARRASVFGVFSAVFLVGSASGAFLSGVVTHALGYGPMWSLLTALLLGGALVSVRLEVAPPPASEPRPRD